MDAVHEIGVETQAALIIGALVLAGVLWIAKTVSDTKQEVAVIRSILVGGDGKNGIVGDMKTVRARVHELAGIIHTVAGQQALHGMRMDHADRDGRQDRRDDK